MPETLPIPLPKESQERRAARVASITAFIQTLPVTRAWEVLVRPFKRERTNPQNRYERGVICVTLSRVVGYEPEEIHEWLLGTYFGWKTKAVPKTPNNPRGIEDIPVRTTTRNEFGERDVLSREKYWEFVEFCQRFGAKLGIYIPDPDPEWFLKPPAAEQEAA